MKIVSHSQGDNERGREMSEEKPAKQNWGFFIAGELRQQASVQLWANRS
jgi:hypothetical protein